MNKTVTAVTVFFFGLVVASWTHIRVLSLEGERAAESLFQTSFVDTYELSWDLAPDGRFLVVKPSTDGADPNELRTILNWFEELQARVPTVNRPGFSGELVS